MSRALWNRWGTFKDGHVQALKDNGLKCWDWDVDSLDWKYSNPDQVMDNVKYYTEMNAKKENLVVLFHEKIVPLRFYLALSNTIVI